MRLEEMLSIMASSLFDFRYADTPANENREAVNAVRRARLIWSKVLESNV